MSKTKILVVDDETDMRRAMEFRLKAEGYETLTATNGSKALEVMRSAKVDLILADFMMPEMKGIELTRTVQSHPQWFVTQVLLFRATPSLNFASARWNWALWTISRSAKALRPSSAKYEGFVLLRGLLWPKVTKSTSSASSLRFRSL